MHVVYLRFVFNKRITGGKKTKKKKPINNNVQNFHDSCTETQGACNRITVVLVVLCKNILYKTFIRFESNLLHFKCLIFFIIYLMSF